MKVYESLREYRRNTASYWLRSARKSYWQAKRTKDSVFIDMAMREMQMYAKWKARAERAEW